MDVTVTGTALGLSTDASSLFSMSFDVTAGRFINAGCDSTTVMSVSGFSGSIANLAVGTTPVSAPQPGVLALLMVGLVALAMHRAYRQAIGS